MTEEISNYSETSASSQSCPLEDKTAEWLIRETEHQWRKYESNIEIERIKAIINCFLKILKRAAYYPSIKELDVRMQELFQKCIDEDLSRRNLIALYELATTKFESILRLVAILTNNYSLEKHFKNKHQDDWNHWDLIMVLELVKSEFINKNIKLKDVPENNCQQLFCRVIEARNNIHKAPQLSNLELFSMVSEALFAYLYVTAKFYGELWSKVKLAENYRIEINRNIAYHEKELPRCFIDISLRSSSGKLFDCIKLDESFFHKGMKCLAILGDGGAGKTTLLAFLMKQQFEQCLQNSNIKPPIKIDSVEITPQRGLLGLIATKLHCKQDDVINVLCTSKRCIFIDRIDLMGRTCRKQFVADILHLNRACNSTTIILFSRLTVYQNFFALEFAEDINIDILTIEPLNEEQITQLFQSHGIDNQGASKRYFEDSTRKIFLSTPQSVTMLAEVGLSPYIKNPDDLTKLYVEKHLEREIKLARSLGPYCKKLLFLLSREESLMFSESTVMKHLDSMPLSSDVSPIEIFESTLNSNIIKRRGELLEFSHNRFRDYFMDEAVNVNCNFPRT